MTPLNDNSGNLPVVSPAAAISAIDEAAPETTLIFKPKSYVEQLPLSEMFENASPLEVELGSGDGSFIVQYARLNPAVNFIGVERLLGRFRKIDRKGLRAGLRNLRLVRLEASYFLAFMLPADSLKAIHIYFPDPWPKRRHWNRRLINDQFAKTVEQKLQTSGFIFLRTDDIPYLEQMQRVFGSNPSFIPVEAPAQLLAVHTDFERGFQQRGVQTHALAFQKIS